MAEITARNAARSPLLRLPGELRNKIFAFAVGGYTIIVNSKGGPAIPFELKAPTKVAFRLAIATEPKLTKTIENTTSRTEGLTYYDIEDERCKAKELTNPERVAHLFTVARVCRQIYAETILLQYKANYFQFNTALALEAFTAKLDGDQISAITTISIDTNYVLDKLMTFGFGPTLLTPSFRELLPNLKTIYFAPKLLDCFTGETIGEKSVKIIEVLNLGGEDDVRLSFGCFDVLDASAE